MAAWLYLAAMTWFGDLVSRRFLRTSSPAHRAACAFLVGLLLCSVITYLGSLSFAWIDQPLAAGNVAFLGALGVAFASARSHAPSGYLDRTVPRPAGSDAWDYACLGLSFAFGCWLIWSTLSFADGNFRFGFKSWSDFGANISLSQSLLLGHNYPTEHPFFPGEPIRYHFLFWFQAANLAYLGLPLITAVNLLSALSLLALLTLIIALAGSLFDSRAVGRIALALFFLASSSLSYVPFLWTQPGPGAALDAVLSSTQFLDSGFPYRGEDWGALTVGVYANQRHLISGVGLLLVVLVSLVDLYRDHRCLEATGDGRGREEAGTDARRDEGRTGCKQDDTAQAAKTLGFCGVLVGLLPYWNGAVFVSALIVLGGLWLFFPFRRSLAWVVGIALLVGLPQVLMLRTDGLTPGAQSFFHWGYVIPEPTVLRVVEYLGWTFGFKWLLIAIALWTLAGAQRRLFLAFAGLPVVVFLFQLSTDAFNNHKLLNVWNLLASLFAAYALWVVGRGGLWRVGLALVLAAATTLGAIIDLFPIRNDAVITVPYSNDRLTRWVLENTGPSEVFLTHPVLAHPIVFAGRKTFLGYTLFAWTAGYRVGDRERVYRRIFAEGDRTGLLSLLRENGIAYVAIDNDLRRSLSNAGAFDESLFRREFSIVFEDTEHRYGDLVVYKPPDR